MGTDSLLGVDLGTSSVKVVVTNSSGAITGQASAGYTVDARHQPGRAESDPADWWRAVVAAVNAAVGKAGVRPVAVGLSGQMHGVVLADAGGAAVRPALLWADGRATAELAAYRALPEESRRRLGNPLSPGMAGPLLLWVAGHEAAAYARARWALQPKDWLRMRLTGVAGAEPSDASATLLYDVFRDGWDKEIVGALGLAAGLLAPLVLSGAVAGELLAGPARELGLTPGIPVAAGAADTAAAALGTGLVRPGMLQLGVGSGGQLVTPLDEPRAAPATHLYRAATPEGWYAMAATLNAGIALEWVIRVLGASWEELYAAAERDPLPGNPIFLPHLAGERTPYLDPALRGAWTGLALGHGRGDLLRSALEGVAFALRDALDALPGADRADHIRLVGGGSTHPAWRQMLADVLERPLRAVDEPAASARGAAFLAGMAAGAVELGGIERLVGSPRPVAWPRPAVATGYAERLVRFRAAVADRVGAAADGG